MLKNRWKLLLNYCLGWMIALCILAIVRGMGTTELGSLKFDFGSSILIIPALGPFLGLASGLTQIYTEDRVYKRISMQRFLLLRLLYTVIFILFMTISSFLIYNFFFKMEVDLKGFVFGEGVLAVIFYLLLIDLLFSVFRQLDLMLGEGNLRKILLGEFYTPRAEERIFMFLDLKSSTSLAEKLGHIRYSMLLQDCFNDLGVVNEHRAEIYQYVGDEAVLSWPIEPGLLKQNCIRAFFRFKDQLKKREAYYQENFACKPVFKAALHLGEVTATEVGKYKREIAYHGDPLNTAARIQGKCNELGQELLISQELKERLDEDTFQFKEMGSELLRGKAEAVAIFGVSRIT